MNTIFKIARAELRNLFYSPVAWFLAIIFMIQCGVYYTDIIYTLSKSQELSMKSPIFKNFGRSLTAVTFLSGGIISNVMQNLYLFIPLLTMGILSREISNGSIKLLYSSPIKTRHIVLGKYLAIMMFSLLLIGIVVIFMITARFNIIEVDYGLLIAALLGFYLLVCAYAAIGLFMSSLTTYQIVSAIGTFMTVFILSKIGSLWQEIDFVRDLTYFLSMPSRTTNMIMGLVTTKDVIYFLLIIGLFLGFTLLKLKSGRESKPWYLTAAKYLGTIVIVLTVGYITSRPQYVGYWDLTATQMNTIHPRVQKIIQDLGDEPLEVTLYVNMFGQNFPEGKPVNRNKYLSALWEKYVRFKPDIKFKYEYYYEIPPGHYALKAFPGKSKKEIAEQTAKAQDLDLNMFQTPEEMKAKIDLEPENFNLVMQLSYKDKKTFLRTYNDMVKWPGEEHVAASIARLTNTKLPLVLFTTGNLERDIYVLGERGYSGLTTGKSVRSSLINNGFDVDSISLDTQDLPNEMGRISTLVLADPKSELSDLKKERIQRYVDRGGNLIVFGEPGKEGIVNPIVRPLGVELLKGTMIQVSKHQPPDVVLPYLTKAASRLAEEPKLLALKKEDNKDTLIIRTPGITPVVSIEHNTLFIKEPLFITKPSVWLKINQVVRDSVPPVLNSHEGDSALNGAAGAMALKRQLNGKEQRIVVLGDADFLSNSSGGAASHIGRGIFSWLNYNEFPKYGPIDPPKDNLLLISSDTASLLKKTFVWILPAILAFVGIMVLIRRKRK